jgi:hypothetical protein
VHRLRIAALAPLALALALGLAVGCSSSASTTSGTVSSTAPGSSTGYPAGKEQVCQARDQLKTSLAALTNPIVLTGGKSGIQSAVTKVQTNLTALSTAAKQDYKPQVDAMQSSLNQLQTTVGNLNDNNFSQNLQSVGSAIVNVGSSANDLFSKLQTACGS